MVKIEKATQREVVLVHTPTGKDGRAWGKDVIVTLHRKNRDAAFAVRIKAPDHVDLKTGEISFCSLGAMHFMFSELAVALTRYNEQAAEEESEKQLDGAPL